MGNGIIVLLALGACLGTVDSFLDRIVKGAFNLVGKVVGSVVKPILGIDSFERQAEQSSYAVQSGISAFNGNVANSLRNLDSYVKNDIIPEMQKLADSGSQMAASTQKLVNEMTDVLIPAATETMDTARWVMTEITGSTRKVADSASNFIDTATEVLIPETAKTLGKTRWMMEEVVNITRELQERVGQSLDNVDYILELVIAVLMIFLGVLGGYELRRIGNVLRPHGFVAIEVHLLRWARIVCFASSLILIVHIIFNVLQIGVFSKPEILVFCLLFPCLTVFSYYLLRSLLLLLNLFLVVLYYVFFIVKYLLRVPYFVLYYLLLAPFVFTYFCFVNRRTHASSFGALIIYCMPVAFSMLYYGFKEAAEHILKSTEKEPNKNPESLKTEADYSLAWLYSLLLNFIIFYAVAIVLRLCYRRQPADI